VQIVEAVQQNALTNNATVKDIEVALGKWLTGARDRGGRRAERAKKTKERKMQRQREAAAEQN
jgi:hypothetical protein